MGFTAHLIHRCTITPQTVSRSARGAISKSGGTAVTDVHCRYVFPPRSRSQFEPMTEVGQQVQTDASLLLKSDATIDTESVVSAITLAADGSSVDVGPFDVVTVSPRNRRTAHHIAAGLKKVE